MGICVGVRLGHPKSVTDQMRMTWQQIWLVMQVARELARSAIGRTPFYRCLFRDSIEGKKLPFLSQENSIRLDCEGCDWTIRGLWQEERTCDIAAVKVPSLPLLPLADPSILPHVGACLKPPPEGILLTSNKTVFSKRPQHIVSKKTSSVMREHFLRLTFGVATFKEVPHNSHPARLLTGWIGR